MQEEKEKEGAAIAIHPKIAQTVVVVVVMRVNSNNEPHSLILNFTSFAGTKTRRVLKIMA